MWVMHIKYPWHVFDCTLVLFENNTSPTHYIYAKYEIIMQHIIAAGTRQNC